MTLMGKYNMLIYECERYRDDPVVGPECRRILRKLRPSPPERILRVVRESGGSSLSEIAKATGMSAQLVAYHVDKLAAEGILVKEGGRRTKIYLMGGSP